MQSYLDQIRRILDHEDWSYSVQENPGHTFLLSSFTGESTRMDVVFDTVPETDTVMCFVYLPVVVPEARRPAVAELAARINYRLSLGCFDFDPDDGVLRARDSLDLQGMELTAGILQGLRDAAIATADHYNAAVMRVLYAGISPKQALDELLAQSGEDDAPSPVGRVLQ